MANHHNSDNPYVQMTPAPPTGNGANGGRPKNKICDALNRYGKRFEDATRKAEVYADNIWHHFKVSPSFTDAALSRISQETKAFTEGGHDKVFHRAFGFIPQEKLLKTYACYLSTPSGPVIGTLYLSTKRVAFCSNNPFPYRSPTGQQQWMYYKIEVQLHQLRTVNPSSNRMNPSEKYIQLVTTDGLEFWFMGFISYDKALKQLSEVLQRSHEPSEAVHVAYT